MHPEALQSDIPILLGYGMPGHADMATPILEEEASNIARINETGMAVIQSELATGCTVEAETR